DNLDLVNLSNASATLIGNMGAVMEGLALAPNGDLFGAGSPDNGGGFPGALFKINRDTGAATVIGDMGRGDIEGIHFIGNQLIGITPNGQTIFSIDTANASTTDIVTVHGGTTGAVALTALNSDTVLTPMVNATFDGQNLAAIN